jgi:S-adenosylmethionine-dependent methyltransferase
MAPSYLETLAMARLGATAETVSVYKEYQKTPSSRLRYRLAIEGIARLHDIRPGLRVLDAAGGNGLAAEYFLVNGHDVTLLDINPAMVEEAQSRLNAAGLMDRCKLVVGALSAAPDLLSSSFYDLVLLHHVIEYVNDVPSILAGLRRLVRRGAELSLITLNPVSEVLRAVFFQHDAAAARLKLTDLRYDARWFGEARLYERDQLLGWAEGAGWRLKDFRGIRVLSDYVPDETIHPGLEADLVKLEIELGGRDPYRLFGRYLQFAFLAG